jgi:hypothetical protein
MFDPTADLGTNAMRLVYTSTATCPDASDSQTRRPATVPLIRGRLDVSKQIAHAHQATVNDLVLAAVTGGLRQLLASRGEEVHALVQRAMVTRPPTSACAPPTGRSPAFSAETAPVDRPPCGVCTA